MEISFWIIGAQPQVATVLTPVWRSAKRRIKSGEKKIFWVMQVHDHEIIAQTMHFRKVEVHNGFKLLRKNVFKFHTSS